MSINNERKAVVYVLDKSPENVIIVDNGEGETPNHDQVIIIYEDKISSDVN